MTKKLEENVRVYVCLKNKRENRWESTQACRKIGNEVRVRDMSKEESTREEVECGGNVWNRICEVAKFNRIKN